MSKETIKVIQIDTDPAKKSIKDLRKELKEYKDQMANLEEGSDAFLEVAKQAGEAKHQIDEINDSIKGASSDFGDMVGNVTNVAAGITGAFQAVAGGLQAMGVESEAIDSAIAKMQGLMAVTQGLSAIDDGIKSFAKLGKAVQTAGNVGSKGMSKLKKALIGTGIGAIVVLVGSLIANWEEFSQAIGISEGAMQKFGNMARGVLNALMESIKGIGTAISRLVRGDFSGAADALKAGFQFGENYQAGVMKAEEAANQKRLTKAAEFEDKKYQIQLERLERFNGSELEKQKKLLGIEQQRLEQLKKQNAEELEIEKQLTKIHKLKKEITNLESSSSDKNDNDSTLGTSVDSAYDLFRKTQSHREKEYKTYIVDLENELAELRAEENKIINRYNVTRIPIDNSSLWTVKDKADTDKEGGYKQGLMDLTEQLELRAKQLGIEDQITAKIKARLAQNAAELETYKNKTELTEEEKKTKEDLITLDQTLTRELILQQDNVNQLEQSYGELATTIAEIGELSAYKELLDFADEMNDQFRILNNTMSLLGESSLGLSGAWRDVVGDMQSVFNDFVKIAVEGNDKIGMNIANSLATTMQFTGTMLNAVSDDIDTSTEEGFEKQKKFQISATIMNMLAGITSAWTSAMNPANAWMTLPGQIAVGVATSAMIAGISAEQIRKIANTQFGGDSTASASVNSGAVNSMIVPPVQHSSAVQGASTEGAIKNAKVYVLESDITETIGKVSVQETENRY